MGLLFEMLVAIGVIAQPLPFRGGPFTSWWLAVLWGGVLFGTLRVVWSSDHRLRPSDLQAPLMLCLVALCGGSFSQLTTVLMPRTLVSTNADFIVQGALANGVVETGLSAAVRVLLPTITATIVVIWIAQVDQRNRTSLDRVDLSTMLTLTVIASAICLFLPTTSAPFGPTSLLDASSPSVLAAATYPARIGAVSFPVLWISTIAIDWLCNSPEPGGKRWLRRTFAFAPLIAVGVLAYFNETKPLLSIPLALGISTLAHLRKLRLRRVRAIGQLPALLSPVAFSTSDVALIFVFFMSGMAALVYQVVFAKGLALTFGSTSHAATIVLSTYMTGLALGSWMGGRYAEHAKRPVLTYASAELGIALLCIFAPLTLKATRAVYVMIASGTDPAARWLVGLQLGLGALVLIPPTFLMGVTLPLLTRHLIYRRESLGKSAGVLYSSNTLGAAAGALGTGYILMPALGVNSSLHFAVGLNVVVAGIALWLGRRGIVPPSVAIDKSTLTEAEPILSPEIDRVKQALGFIALAQLTVGGFITFGLETSFVHLLATIAGNSTYAFSLMLFAFLIGLGFGSNVTRRWLRANRDYATALLLCQACLALTLLLGVPYWDAIPNYFSLFAAWAPAKSFAARELIRFLACLAVMLPPALCIGAQFPIAMEVIGRAWPQRRLSALGFASALNTSGNILGALLVGFVFLPFLGSLSTLHLLTVACLLLAALSIPYTALKMRLTVVALMIIEVVLYLKQPAQFNLAALASGGNVYFQWQNYGRVIDSAESLDGGLTTVAITGEERPWAVLTLLTNGKFQGDDSKGGEMKAQSSFALAPLLHTRERERALVIGFGTGTTTKVFHQAGFRHIDVAELSGDILTLADRHFRAVNEGVLHQAEVKAHVTDGRNFLLLEQSMYNIVSIELSSIWFSGAANLYNREFYQLVRARLAPGGVLQQWVQLHRLSENDIATILSTLEDQFPQVWLYFLGKQGILVACADNCQPSKQTLDDLDQTSALAPTLSLFDGHAAHVLKGRLLTPQTLEKLVRDARRQTSPGQNIRVATDDNLTLEYSTPKGNVRKYDESLDQNLRYLERFKAENILDATHLSPEDVPYLSGPI